MQARKDRDHRGYSRLEIIRCSRDVKGEKEPTILNAFEDAVSSRDDRVAVDQRTAALTRLVNENRLVNEMIENQCLIVECNQDLDDKKLFQIKSLNFIQ